ncbi:MAG TPA: serine/threonine-protein kinase, partial [Pirellulaceae bacterium]|nr:serine/threonine-protein kinase [Pirellulaceae bacterium]
HVTHHAHGAKPPHCAELTFSGGQSNDRGESDSGDSSTSNTPFAAQDRSMADDASAARSPEPSLPCVPGLEVLAPIGRGGMGIVFEAYDPHLRRRVALKMISRERTSPEWTERIRLEAQAAARLNHPHVVQIYGVGECDGQPYVTLELVGGGTLADRLQGRPQSPREGAVLVAKLARAVQFAHERHVVHRDLKPRNVLIDEIGLTAETPLSAVTPKITDFGLAKLLDSELQQTRTDQIMGTPAYAAPEQLNAALGEVGPATDVYALGAVFYEILTGRPPLQADDIWRTMQLVLETEPVAPRQLQPGVPRDLETICLHCLAKDPARRYVGAGELADDLDRFLADQPIRARPISAVERFMTWASATPSVGG